MALSHRAIRPLSQHLPRFSQHPRQLRSNSTNRAPPPETAASQQQKPVSPHIGFYKTFGRPIAKVFLGAILTYQSVYLLWYKLEKDEEKQQLQAEIGGLETRLKEVREARKP